MNGVDFPVSKVLDGIAAAREAGLTPIKVNTVVRRGMNEDLGAAAGALGARRGPDPAVHRVHGRGPLERLAPGRRRAGGRDPRLIDAAMPLEPVPAQYRGEVAGRYAYRDGSGELGVIASVTSRSAGTARGRACRPRGRSTRACSRSPEPTSRARSGTARPMPSWRPGPLRLVDPRRPLLRAAECGNREAAQGGDVRARRVSVPSRPAPLDPAQAPGRATPQARTFPECMTCAYGRSRPSFSAYPWQIALR